MSAMLRIADISLANIKSCIRKGLLDACPQQIGAASDYIVHGQASNKPLRTETKKKSIRWSVDLQTADFSFAQSIVSSPPVSRHPLYQGLRPQRAPERFVQNQVRSEKQRLNKYRYNTAYC